MRTPSWTSSRTTRAVAGLVISLVFAALTVSRVDPAVLATVASDLDLVFLLVAAALSIVEVCVRAARSKALIAPLGHVGFASALAYLSFGHLANAVLPARLGDVARAMLAGGRLGVSRVSVLGTIAVERVADAGLLAFALAGGVVIGYSDAVPTLVALVAIVIVCVAVLAIAAVSFRRLGWATGGVGLAIRHHTSRFLSGATALRNPADAARIAAYTVVSFAFATGIMAAGAAAAGINLPPWQAALVVAAVTLSTAIPAGPASLGTYEFVGVTVMSSMGYPAEASLLGVAAVHLIATTVPALMGLVAMWHMGVTFSGRSPSRALDSSPGQAGG